MSKPRCPHCRKYYDTVPCHCVTCDSALCASVTLDGSVQACNNPMRLEGRAFLAWLRRYEATKRAYA